MYKIILFFTYALFLYACSPVSTGKLNRAFRETEKKFQDHTGFCLYDLESKKELYQFNANKYFTPASNTKVFTFYSSLKIIGDSIPALKFITHGDSLIFWGTGDPSFLYKNVFNNNRVYNFLKAQERQLYFSSANFKTDYFGRGWAWDDYNDYYSTEKYSFPVYGNIISITENKNSISVTPKIFNESLVIGNVSEKSTTNRGLTSNLIVYSPGKNIKNKTWSIPFKIDSLLIARLIQDTLKKAVTLIYKPLPSAAKIIYSVPADSVYRVMMQESDNFIAEQLLLVCAGIISDTLKTEIAINYALSNQLQGLKDKPVWVDGSGLSRYNLVTPRTLVQLWEKLYAEIPRGRLFNLVAVGGKSGTLKNSYKGSVPYIFGKTGTLTNNHNLSGYLITRKGKVLIFSFMNNNHPSPTTDIRKNMEAILVNIRDHY